MNPGFGRGFSFAYEGGAALTGEERLASIFPGVLILALGVAGFLGFIKTA
jgi:hypothetical protein